MGNEHDAVEQLKPSRSEDGEILTEQEKEQHARQLQEFLTATTPVRPLKPSRSENLDNVVFTDKLWQDANKAEQKRFKELEADKEVLHTEGGTVNDDSYMETPYYDDLNAVDKIFHHKTGSGFIATELSKFCFTVGEDGEKVFMTTNKTNPATNEWQPSPPADWSMESKVHRSDP